jgi:hypothetical protein
MHRRLINEDVDLALLADETSRFLENKGFEVVKIETETGHKIIAGNSPSYKMEDMLITFDGKPEDFTIDLESAGEKKEDQSSLPVMLATMMGFGYFVLKRMKSDETWIRFKAEFSRQMSLMIANLRFSSHTKEK